MTNANIGWGASFGIEGGTPGTYVKLAEVKAITPPGATRNTVDATHLESPDKWMEYIAGMKDTGEASITLNYVPSATDALFAAFNDETGNYEVTFPNGVMLRFGGIVTGWTPPELTPEGVMEATITIKPTGAPTLHAAS